MILLLGPLVAVVAVHQGREVHHDVLLEVGRTVELAVLVTDDDTNFGVVVGGRGLPGLQTDAVRRLGTLDLEALGEGDAGDDVVVVGRLAKGNGHGDSSVSARGSFPLADS